MENKNINQLIEEILKRAADGEFEVEVVKLEPKEPEDDQWKKDAADHAAKIFAEVAGKYLTDRMVQEIIKDFIPKYITSLDELGDDEE
jgi:hypothetical protein